MESKEFEITQDVLKLLGNQMHGFYLLGGTALSLCYFHHRESYDLDFFTKDFSQKRIFEVIEYLKDKLKVRVKLAEQNLKENYAKVMVYQIEFGDGMYCKIDFVEDFFPLLKPLTEFNHINVASLEDIYLRKIYTVTGFKKSENAIGADVLIGGRQEAKDFYDLYCLSTITMPLTSFVHQFGDATMKEGIIAWFRSYNRMEIKTALIDLKTTKPPDYREIEKHFQKQVDNLISEEIL